MPPDLRVRARLADLLAEGDGPAAELGPGLARAVADLAATRCSPRGRLLARTTSPRSPPAASPPRSSPASSTRTRPFVPVGVTRDAVVGRLAAVLGASARGAERGVRSLALRVASSAASRAVVRRRRALTEAAHPAAGTSCATSAAARRSAPDCAP